MGGELPDAIAAVHVVMNGNCLPAKQFLQESKFSLCRSLLD